jgi:phosphatidylglycerophosphate synthase
MPEVESPGRVSAVEQTYKSRDVEGWLDIVFYRPIGYQLARLCASIGLTPSAVSLIGAAIGMIGGHFYYYSDLRLNLFGFALQVIANAFDNADGQLARLTNRGSIYGAIVDGFADHLVFISVYLHLVLRYMAEGGSSAIWILAVAAGMSHAVQSMIADCFRESYLRFVAGKGRGQMDSSREVRAACLGISWNETGRKLAMASYGNYVRQQEILAPKLFELRAEFRGAIPKWLRDEYGRGARPLIKWENMFAANFRMFLLLVFLLLRWPPGFFWCEVTLLNVILGFLLWRHDRLNRELLVRHNEEKQL